MKSMKQTESSDSSQSSIAILRGDNLLNVIQSDSEISDSKIIFDQNHIDELTQSRQKQSRCDGKKRTISSHVPAREDILSYGCSFLFDDSDSEQIEQTIIDEKKKQLIKYKPVKLKKQSIDLSVLNKHPSAQQLQQPQQHNHNTNDNDETDDSDDCFYLFNEHECLSEDDENEINMSKYTDKISLAPIKIPETEKELLTPIRPAFRLHLEMIDVDGSIKRQIIQQRRKYLKKQEKLKKEKLDKSRSISLKKKRSITLKKKNKKNKKNNKNSHSQNNKLGIIRTIRNGFNNFICADRSHLNLKVLNWRDSEYLQ